MDAPLWYLHSYYASWTESGSQAARGSPCHYPYSMHVEMPMGASIKYVRTKGEGGGLKAAKYVYDSTDRLRGKRTRGGEGVKRSRKIGPSYLVDAPY